ncbi:single-stranded DNA-binding protein [Myxococcota bacterium]|nr:single-stranded DNA-binding protein [Myxococcota bacterium]
MDIASKLGAATRRLCRELAPLSFGAPVTHVYNPLVHARRPHNAYLRRYGNSTRRVIFLGMNPGPFGMAQTGVPFGDVAMVRDWLEIEERVTRPEVEHPKRPVLGFDCTRSEVSGTRLWGALRDHFKRPEHFFADHFIANYCPLIFIEETGRNRTPDKLPAHEREPLFEACDRHLQRLVRILEPQWVIGIGAFAQTRAEANLTDGPQPPRIGRILHPSPANPHAQKDWGKKAHAELVEQGVCTPRRGRASSRRTSRTR